MSSNRKLRRNARKRAKKSGKVDDGSDSDMPDLLWEPDEKNVVVPTRTNTKACKKKECTAAPMAGLNYCDKCSKMCLACGKDLPFGYFMCTKCTRNGKWLTLDSDEDTKQPVAPLGSMKVSPYVNGCFFYLMKGRMVGKVQGYCVYKMKKYETEQYDILVDPKRGRSEMSRGEADIEVTARFTSLYC